MTWSFFGDELKKSENAILTSKTGKPVRAYFSKKDRPVRIRMLTRRMCQLHFSPSSFFRYVFRAKHRFRTNACSLWGILSVQYKDDDRRIYWLFSQLIGTNHPYRPYDKLFSWPRSASSFGVNRRTVEE